MSAATADFSVLPPDPDLTSVAMLGAAVDRPLVLSGDQAPCAGRAPGAGAPASCGCLGGALSAGPNLTKYSIIFSQSSRSWFCCLVVFVVSWLFWPQVTVR